MDDDDARYELRDEMKALVTLGAKGRHRGRPSNREYMTPQQVALQEDRLNDLSDKFKAYRAHVHRYGGLDDEREAELRGAAVRAIRACLNRQATWRQIGDAMGIDHSGARRWFLRHGKRA